ncbi:MAG: glycosyltransferase [Anaerorhabdus sp.]|uniref:glycosyltransferase n=1 Tax=Anaerorhabdus sp. TaxID=1872524 RepID=UPI002FC95B0F
MKILQINSVYGYASTGKIMGMLHEKLLKDGHESYIIYSRKEPKNVNMTNVTKIYSPLGVAIHAALAVFFDTHGLYSKHNTKKIIKCIEKINPEIVHLHVLHGFYLNYPMLFDYLKKTNKKIVWTLHDCWEYTGYCAYYDYNQCEEWKTGCKNCRFRNTYPYRILSHSKKNFRIKSESYKDADMILVSPSVWLDSEVQKSMMSDFKHCVINNNVKLDNFYYEDSNLRSKYNLNNKKVLLTVANVWTMQKGLNEIIKLSSYLDENKVLVIIGVSKNQIKKLPSNIIGIQRIQIDELRKWYSTADVFINCTLEENYPTVNLEAKACGLPIISYRTGGSPEMLDKHDVIVEKYDITAMIKSIDLVKRFTPSINGNQMSMYDNYLNLYQKICKSKI